MELTPFSPRQRCQGGPRVCRLSPTESWLPRSHPTCPLPVIPLQIKDSNPSCSVRPPLPFTVWGLWPRSGRAEWRQVGLGLGYQTTVCPCDILRYLMTSLQISTDQAIPAGAWHSIHSIKLLESITCKPKALVGSPHFSPLYCLSQVSQDPFLSSDLLSSCLEKVMQLTNLMELILIRIKERKGQIFFLKHYC